MLPRIFRIPLTAVYLSKENHHFGRPIEDFLVDPFPTSLVANVEHEDSAYVIDIPGPGMTRKNIRVTIDNNVLKVTAEKSRVKRMWWKVQEYNSSYFQRSFVLPHDADVSRVSASCKHGLLTVRIEKAKHAGSGRIIPVEDVKPYRLSPLKEWWLRTAEKVKTLAKLQKRIVRLKE
jgi:HSP20 family molecular chaperone IbpA